MKVLIYIEPHPIRNEFTHFVGVAKDLKAILQYQGDVDFRVFSNSETLTAIEKESIVDKAKIIYPVRIEREFFNSLNVDWTSTGLQVWQNLMDGGEIAEQYLPIFRRIWQLFPFDVIMHWGENGAVRLFQKEQNFTAIGMELGCTRPPFFDSVVFDPYGTNGAAILPRLDIKDIEKIVNGVEMTASNAMMLFSGNEILAYEQQFLPIPTSISAKLLNKKPKVFLPLQLFDDANLLKFSPYKTIKDVVLDVVPKLVLNGYQVIIKPHPASKFRKGALLANQIAKGSLAKWADSIVWCDQSDVNYNNIQLIQVSDFVVTVNSSVGFEALYFDKPTVVLGDAIYKPKNINRFKRS